MAKQPVNLAASVRQRLLNIAREQGQVFDVVLVRYALERLLYRLSISSHRDRFILKGGMLVTLLVEDENRVTRDADFLGHGDASEDGLKATFAEIMGIAVEDGLEFDIEKLTVTAIREEMEYGGTRLKTTAFLERTRIPITLDIAFGDALAAAPNDIDYPTLLDMETPKIRAYPPATVIAEKFQAMVALGIANGRMKDYYDLWAIPKMISFKDEELDAAIAATFKRRRTDVPKDRPPGLSAAFVEDETKQRQWRAYAESVELKGVSLADVVETVWTLVGPSCQRLANK
jgi:predicted nucleotidyltransferase component of viral defense system